MMITLDCVDKGFRGRSAKWRIAFSKNENDWNPNNDARCVEYIKLKNENKAFVKYIKCNKSQALSFIRRMKELYE